MRKRDDVRGILRWRAKTSELLRVVGVLYPTKECLVALIMSFSDEKIEEALWSALKWDFRGQLTEQP